MWKVSPPKWQDITNSKQYCSGSCRIFYDVNNNHFTISTNSALYIWELLNNKWQILFLPFNLWTIESIHFADSVQYDTPFWIPYPNRCVWNYTKESVFYFFITSKVSMARNWLGLKNLRPCVRQKSFINRENMCRSAFVCKNITTEVKGIMKGYLILIFKDYSGKKCESFTRICNAKLDQTDPS